MKRAKSGPKKRAQARLNTRQAQRKLPFIEHIYELRKRLYIVAFSVVVFSIGAYFVQHQLVAFLLKPARDQEFIYTTPGGGLDFLFRVCLYAGVFFSIPIIFRQFLHYLAPLLKHDVARFIRRGSAASALLAVAGMAFGYFIALPASLHFLLNQFTGEKIEAMLSIQSYMSFVTIYLLVSAMLFQLPLIMLMINRIRPLTPKKLFSYERWVILIAAILGGIISPSPNATDQLLLAGPMILTYQVGIALVWLANRKNQRPKHVEAMIKEDAEARARRLARARTAQLLPIGDPLPVTPLPPVLKEATDTLMAANVAIAAQPDMPAATPAPRPTSLPQRQRAQPISMARPIRRASLDFTPRTARQ